MIQLCTPAKNAELPLLQDCHIHYIHHPHSDPTTPVDWLHLRQIDIDLSCPRTHSFTFTPPTAGEIVLLTPDGQEQIWPAKNGCAEITNLLPGTTYVWYVRALGESSPRSRFFTSPLLPRPLAVDGISNVRDFGGYRCADGKHRVRFDRIWRSSEMDTHIHITPAGKETLLSFGIHTDLDLRGVAQEPRGPILDQTRVAWCNYPLAAYAEIFSEEQRYRYGESYRLLTQENVYPLLVHCWGGIDRTGCWLYILGAMLGVSQADLEMDYEFSSFSRWGERSRHSEQFQNFYKGLFAYGDTLTSAARGFMKAAGLTDTELDLIKQHLLEEI